MEASNEQESSLVIIGSNYVTGQLGTTREQEEKETKEEKKEPPKGTQTHKEEPTEVTQKEKMFNVFIKI